MRGRPAAGGGVDERQTIVSGYDFPLNGTIYATKRCLVVRWKPPNNSNGGSSIGGDVNIVGLTVRATILETYNRPSSFLYLFIIYLNLLLFKYLYFHSSMISFLYIKLIIRLLGITSIIVFLIGYF